MNQIQVTCDKECIYRNDGFCECDQHLLDVAEEFLRLKRGEEVEHLKERESIGAASMECFLKKNVIQNLEEKL